MIQCLSHTTHFRGREEDWSSAPKWLSDCQMNLSDIMVGRRRLPHIWSRATSWFPSVSALFLTAPARSDKQSTWTHHGNTVMDRKYVGQVVEPRQQHDCKHDTWYYDTSEHRIAQIIKAACFCLVSNVANTASKLWARCELSSRGLTIGPYSVCTLTVSFSFALSTIYPYSRSWT